MSLKIVYHELVDLPDDSDPIEVLPECDSDLIVGLARHICLQEQAHLALWHETSFPTSDIPL